MTAPGARALEAVLLGELEPLLPSCAEELEPPVRIVVPSKSMRSHLSSRLVQWQGKAVAGVVVQTLYATALEICQRAGRGMRVSDATYEVLARRLAADEPSLRAGLGFLSDGYAGVMATVRDLLDAGFEPALVEPLLDQLGSLAGGALPIQVIERAAALVRVAGGMAEQAEQLAACRSSDLLRRADDLLKDGPELVLPSRAVVIYGYADATGTVLDLLETMTRSLGALVLVDQPPDPVNEALSDAVTVFSQPFLERLSGSALPEEPPVQPRSRVALSGLAAATRDEEVREVALQLRDLLDSGDVVPESIAVVARDLNGYACALRRSFDRFGIPWSAIGGTVATGESRRRVSSLVALLRSRQRLPADRWLDIVAETAPRHDSLAALRTAGVARLEDLAGIDLLRSGRDRASGALKPPSFELLVELVSCAAACCEQLASLPSVALPAGHRDSTLRLLEALGWSSGDDRYQPLEDAVTTLAGVLAPDWPLSSDEWVLLLAAELERLSCGPLAGRGGGVQVLNVMEARGRTFSTLFLLGLVRDVFPRVIREDPLLPDTVRGRLAVVLPDIPVKARGWAEERFLFAQLLAAAPRVHLSRYRSDRGQPVAPSPFIERLRLEGGLEPLQPPSRWSDAEPSSQRSRPAFEHVVAAGLVGDRQAWTTAMQAAIEEGRGRARAAAPVPIAVDPLAVTARRTLLDEVDPPRRRDAVSPFAGLIGSAAAPWPGSLVITDMESMARCPWQAFVTRILGATPGPDPLLELPDADPRLVGTLVHRVLQRIVQEETGSSGAGLGEALLRLPVDVSWPSDSRLEALLAAEAEVLVLQEGAATRRGLGAMLALLVEAARPFLETARRVEWQAGRSTVPASGAEVGGSELVAGRMVHFRADRVDATGAGPKLTDYKTGRNPVSSRRTESGRRKLFLEEVKRGRMLQAVLYAAAAGGRGAVGRYLFLRPDDSSGDAKAGPPELAVTAEDEELMAAFTRATEVIITAVQEGSFFPRVEEAGSEREGGWCRSCRVREACQRSDSAFRRRLVAWLDRHRPPAPRDQLHPAEAAAVGLWWLGVGSGEQQGE